jgi:hypothetical protein
MQQVLEGLYRCRYREQLLDANENRFDSAIV